MVDLLLEMVSGIIVAYSKIHHTFFFFFSTFAFGSG